LGLPFAPELTRFKQKFELTFQFPLIGIAFCTLSFTEACREAGVGLSIPVNWDCLLHRQGGNAAMSSDIQIFQFPLIGIAFCTSYGDSSEPFYTNPSFNSR